MDSIPRLLTITEAAQVLGCSEANVYSLIESGKIPYVAVGRKKGYRIASDDLLLFIQSRKVRKQLAETKPVVRRRLRHIRI